MNLLEKIKKIRGAEEALGITFCTRDRMNAHLPEGSRLLGYSTTLYFCFIEGYQETVFAVDDIPGDQWRSWPVAYNFEDFLRLVFACGCAELSARAALMSKNKFSLELDAQWRRPHGGLIKLRSSLPLTPIQDPYDYIHTVGQLIDCSKIARKSS